MSHSISTHFSAHSNLFLLNPFEFIISTVSIRYKLQLFESQQQCIERNYADKEYNKCLIMFGFDIKTNNKKLKTAAAVFLSYQPPKVVEINARLLRTEPGGPTAKYGEPR